MKQGNQFFLEVQVEDDKTLLNNDSILNIVFQIGNISKQMVNDEVTYDSEKQCYKIWLTQEETFNLNGNFIPIECRVLFKNDTIMGSEILQEKLEMSYNEDVL